MSRGFLSAAIALAALALVSAPALRAAPFIRGDSNADGFLDISDAVSTLTCLFLGGECRPCWSAADSNDDGSIDISDAVSTLDFLFLGGRALPAPYPRCGHDPTPDALECPAHAPCEEPLPLVARIEVLPRSILFTRPGETVQLTARALDANGDPVEASIEWSSSNEATVTIGPDGLAASAAASGSAQIIASAGGAASPPVLALLAAPAPGAILIEDSQVERGPEAVDPAAPYGLGWRYRVGLSGIAPPAPGEILIGRGEIPLAGRVVESAAGGGSADVTLELIPLSELFAGLEISERIDLSHAEFEIDPRISQRYEVRRLANGNLQFLPRAAPGGGAEEEEDDTFMLGPFECKLTIEPPSLPEAPSFDLALNLGLEFGYSSAAGGFQKLILSGSPEASFDFEPIFNAAVEGNLNCKTTLVELILPVGGFLSWVFAGKVPIGIGFEVEGSAGAGELGIKMDASASAELKLGIACAGGGCGMVTELSGSVEGSITPEFPEPTAVELDLTARAFAFAAAKFGNPLLQFLQFEALEMDIGPALELKLAHPQAQAADPDSASGFRFLISGKAAAGSDVEKLAEMLEISFELPDISLEYSYEKDLDRSPQGAFAISPPVVEAGTGEAQGELATFTVTLESSTFLGLEAVEGVEIYWLKNGALGPGRPGCTSLAASPGQTVFSCQTDFLQEHAGGQTFYAFVKAKMFGVPLLFPLEVNKNGSASVTVASPPPPSGVALTGRWDCGADVSLETGPGGCDGLPYYQLQTNIDGVSDGITAITMNASAQTAGGFCSAFTDEESGSCVLEKHSAVAFRIVKEPVLLTISFTASAQGTIDGNVGFANFTSGRIVLSGDGLTSLVTAANSPNNPTAVWEKQIQLGPGDFAVITEVFIERIEVEGDPSGSGQASATASIVFSPIP